MAYEIQSLDEVVSWQCAKNSFIINCIFPFFAFSKNSGDSWILKTILKFLLHYFKVRRKLRHDKFPQNVSNNPQNTNRFQVTFLRASFYIQYLRISSQHRKSKETSIVKKEKKRYLNTSSTKFLISLFQFLNRKFTNFNKHIFQIPKTIFACLLSVYSIISLHVMKLYV